MQSFRTLPWDTQKKIDFHVAKIASSYKGAWSNTLFDPVQSHAIYGVSPDNVLHLKEVLKNLGAKRFRVIKNRGYPIVCFNAVNLKVE